MFTLLSREHGSHLPKSASLDAFTDIAENTRSTRLTLILQRSNYSEPMEEVVLRVQGYLMDARLPPIRQTEYVCKVLSALIHANPAEQAYLAM